MAAMEQRPVIVLNAVLRVMRPIARLLLRYGVGYPAFAAALKQVFLSAAVDDLQRLGKKQTDSAISLLSGVHRRDVRNLAKMENAGAAMEQPMSLASEVAARWLTDARYCGADGRPLELARSAPSRSFDALAAEVSTDVRPRAILDEMVRLGVAQEHRDRVRLVASGFAPRNAFIELARLYGDNLEDHAHAAGLNLEGGHDYLDQALHCDELSAESVHHLKQVAAGAWREALKTLMRETRSRFERDRAHASPGERVHRVRFGSYFYSSDDHDRPS